MCTREPVPDRRDGGDHPEQKPLGQLLDSEHELWSRPGLTIAEAARTCGVSASTIRRYLAAGRFPTAHQQPSPIPGQRGLWRIPTQDLLAAGLRPGQARLPDQEQNNEPRAAEPPASLVLTGFQSSSTPWSLSGPVAEPPRPGRRAGHTIQSLEGALAALRAHHAGPPPNSARAAPSPTPPLPNATIGRHGHSRASPPARHVADGAQATAGQARTQPGEEGGHHRAGAEQATATKATLALAKRSDDATPIDIYSGRVVQTIAGARTACPPSPSILSR